MTDHWQQAEASNGAEQFPAQAYRIGIRAAAKFMAGAMLIAK